MTGGPPATALQCATMLRRDPCALRRHGGAGRWVGPSRRAPAHRSPSPAATKWTLGPPLVRPGTERFLRLFDLRLKRTTPLPPRRTGTPLVSVNATGPNKERERTLPPRFHECQQMRTGSLHWLEVAPARPPVGQLSPSVLWMLGGRSASLHAELRGQYRRGSAQCFIPLREARCAASPWWS